MQHCSGDETQGYFNKIASKEIELWSLRDRYNNPHCTVEYDTNWHIIHQIKGKNNKGILNKYVRYLQEFITYMKNITQITFEGNTLAALGIFVQNNRWCSIEDIPENYVVDGDLNLGGSNIEYLPIGLHVKGNCYLSGTRLKEIGKGLCVDGDATFAYTCIKCIPSGVIIKGNLHLANSAVEHLSLDLVVGGTLDLRGTHIRNNPKDCKNVHRIIPYFNK
jgi:hypothetical protein